MKKVPVSKEYFAFVDDEDYDHVIQFKWHRVRGGRNNYASTSIAGKKVSMHRMIMQAAKGIMIDHADGDGLNNRKANLRPASYAQNFQNTGPRKTRGRTSRFKGVWRIKQSCQRCWRSGITAYRRYRNIGSFWTEEEAARAYDAQAWRLHGEFARPNFPEPKPNASDVPGHTPVIRDHQPKADEGQPPQKTYGSQSRRPRCSTCRRRRGRNR